MQNYAKMVERALEHYGGDQVQVKPINLLTGLPDLSWLPSRWQWRLQQLWLIVTAPHRLNRLKVDLVHLLDGSFAYILKGVNHNSQVVITIHDLIPLLQAKGHFPVPLPNQFAKFLIKRTLKVLTVHENHLCADSLATARDLNSFLSLSTFPTILHLSVRQELLLHKAEICASWKSRVQDGSRFILHVGNNGFYKNRSGVLQVFAQLHHQYPTRLILAGDPLDTKLKTQAKTLGILDKIYMYPNPNDVQLAQLYEKASLLLFPSYYEGFGWPPLEAMAFGCPVVCSNAGSLPEVVGDAALTAAPDDYTTLAKHCLSLLSDPSLAEEILQLGWKNLKRFSDKQMALKLLKFYQDNL